MSSTASDMKKNEWGWKVCCAALLLAAIVSLVLGLLLRFWIIPAVVETMIKQNSQLVEGSRLMTKWMKPEYKVDFMVWVHSVKNPDEILNGEIPEVRTTGPYVFTKKMENKVLSHVNGTVKFKRYDYKYFNESNSCPTCILGNRVWVPNMIYQKFVEAASSQGMRAAATTLLTQTAFLEVEVGELLFDGYKDPFLDQICEIPFMNFVCESILDVPDRIGLLYGTNGTADGVYEINDGVVDTADLAKVVRWNGDDHVDETWWSDEEARRIRGTEGNLFPPFIDKSKRLYVFITQLCRSVYLEFQKEVEYRGVLAYRFVLPGDVFDQSLDENKGFCNPTDKIFFEHQNKTKCWPKGLLEISRCQRGQPPVVISLPNFHLAAEEVKKSVKGLNESDAERDEIMVDIEPHIGAVLSARRVFQINVEMWKGHNLAFPVNLKKMRSSIVPVITVHEVAEIDEDSFSAIKGELIETTSLAYSASTVTTLLAIPFFLAFVGLVLHKSGALRDLLGSRRRERAISPLPAYKPNPDYPTDSYM